LTIVATYDYVDGAGDLVYQKVRLGPKKSFRQRRPFRGGWAWGLTAGIYVRRDDGDWHRPRDGESDDGGETLPDTPRVLYRLPSLLAADPEDVVIYVEGEKDADRLAAEGLTATTAGGSSDWRAEMAETLAGRDVVIIPDNDQPGRRLARQVARAVAAVRARVRMVELPGLGDGGDVSDWLAENTVDKFWRVVGETPEWSDGPADEPKTRNGVNGSNGKHHPVVRRSRPVTALADEIRALASLPRVSWGFKELDRLAPLIVGGLAIVIGATGRGKTSFLFQLGRHHAKTVGPVLVISAELIGAIAGARLVSAELGRSWYSVLDNKVSDEDLARALDFPNMRIIDEVSGDTLELIKVELEAFATEYPGKVPLVLVDYLQLIPGGEEVRARVSDNVVELRRLMAKMGAFAFIISKAGRVAAKELRKGEALGTDATEAGAETGQIEHEATALVALGAMRPKKAEDPDGPGIVDVSLAKARFGIGDKVIPLEVDLASGRFSESGDAMSATDRRAEAKAMSEDVKVGAAVRAIRDLVSKAAGPLSKQEIKREIGGNSTLLGAAIMRLERSGELVQVVGEGIKRKGGQAPLWTEELARAAGLSVVPRTVTGQ